MQPRREPPCPVYQALSVMTSPPSVLPHSLVTAPPLSLSSSRCCLKLYPTSSRISGSAMKAPPRLSVYDRWWQRPTHNLTMSYTHAYGASHTSLQRLTHKLTASYIQAYGVLHTSIRCLTHKLMASYTKAYGIVHTSLRCPHTWKMKVSYTQANCYSHTHKLTSYT